jgi:hypothetical protein
VQQYARVHGMRSCCTLHGALDYGFFTAMLMVPRLLGLLRRARLVAAALGSAQGGLNAVTDQPLPAWRLVAFRTHGSVDRPDCQ